MQSEYGWSDEQIGELTLARFRQIVAAVQQRQLLRDHEENRRFSWLARNLSMMVAGGYMVEKGKPNPGFEAAEKMAYDDIEAAMLGVIVETGEKAPQDNSNGSYERFMTQMGQLDMRGKMI